MVRTRAMIAGSALLLAASGLSCSRSRQETPAREAVLPLLQKEAQSLKTDGERLNPALGVTAVWNIAGVDVVEQPSDPARPWRGTIRFSIESRTKGFADAQRFEKTFNYVYDAGLKQWLSEYTPAKPVPRTP